MPLSFTTSTFRQGQIIHVLHLNCEDKHVIDSVIHSCESYPEMFDELYEISQNKEKDYEERAVMILTAYTRYKRINNICPRRGKIANTSYAYEVNTMRRSYSEGYIADYEIKNSVKKTNSMISFGKVT